MKFANMREYRGGLAGILEYLKNDLSNVLRDLRAGLLKLRFEDNFECFVVTLSIAPSTELLIPNQLKFIPQKRLILKSNQGGLSVCDGDTAWTLEALYLKNTSATLTAEISVAFMR